MIDQEKVMVQPNIWDDLSFEEKVWFYQNWKRAKLSQIKFCTKHRLPVEEFIEWCNEMDRCSMEESESLSPQHCSLQNRTGFCEIELMQPVQPANIMMTVELSFPNKVKARIEANEQQFALLLREMLHATSTIR